MSQCPLRQDDFIVLLTLCLMSRWVTVTCTVWERRKGFLAEWWCPSSTLQLTGCLLDMWSTRTRAAPTDLIQRRSVDYCTLHSPFFSLLCCSWLACSLGHPFISKGVSRNADVGAVEGRLSPCFATCGNIVCLHLEQVWTLIWTPAAQIMFFTMKVKNQNP